MATWPLSHLATFCSSPSSQCSATISSLSFRPIARIGGATGWYYGNQLWRLPGRAWLQFEVSAENSGSAIRQTALFDPVGLGGLLYWYGLWPVHRLVFAGMLRRIAKEAEMAR